jgi:hypothetical protein
MKIVFSKSKVTQTGSLATSAIRGNQIPLREDAADPVKMETLLPARNDNLQHAVKQTINQAFFDRMIALLNPPANRQP